MAPECALARRSDQTLPYQRRHFVTISYDWHYTQPVHFADHPLADLLGTEVASAQQALYDYRTRDGAIFIDVAEFSQRQQGLSLTVYPFGMGNGATLALRGSVEALPVVRLAFAGQPPFSSYALTNARSLDGAAGVYVADRPAGWGLGSHAFVLGGIGKITSDLGDGSPELCRRRRRAEHRTVRRRPVGEVRVDHAARPRGAPFPDDPDHAARHGNVLSPDE